METKILRHNDKMTYAESNERRILTMEDFAERHKGPFRTRITGMDEFGNVLFDMEQNLVVLGGAITTLEKLWNVRSALTVDTINNICNINQAEQTEAVWPQEHCVCLWGVGIGGCGDAFGSVRDVKYYEREIGNNGMEKTEMIPFRIVATPFTDDNAEKYFLQDSYGNDRVAYYAKTFDEPPFIRSLWKDGAEGEDGTEVVEGVHETTRTDDIETFVEMHMTLDKTDMREYFSLNGQIEMARVNTIGLFTATPVVEDGIVVDYKDVKLFSKFSFSNEPLSVSKSILILYRCYAS